MTEKHETKKLLPPYLPYKTFVNFLDGLKATGLPQRIDRSLMKSTGGILQSQIMLALKYLALIDPKTDIPTDKLDRLIHLESEGANQTLKEILVSSYGFLFEQGFDLSRATTNQLEERFHNAGASGDTLRKCMAFFMKVAKEAGLEVSPYIKVSRVRITSTKTRRKSSNSGQDQDADSSIPQGGTTPEKPEDLSWQKFLFEKFPKFDPTWTDEVKKEWFQAIRGLKPDFEKKSDE